MYLFLITFLTLLALAGYSLGRKRNLSILKSVGNSLEEILKPDDQDYTWLGGSIGFNANYKCKDFKKVEATLTLLPRQSPLYYPVSFLVSGFDRLYVTFFLKSKFKSEGHIINKRYFKFRGPKIENIQKLSEEEQEGFLILSQDQRIRSALLNFFKELENLGFLEIIKHIAIVPDRNTVFVLVVPRKDHWSRVIEKAAGFALKLK
ncbi:MAG TPA: hypothetical protein QF468_03840 [Nitrospinota bacterium]|jgi:hypothetical protein|nr:hypothetical protein [Nitrospinota bacterium]|tara:strand:- start:55 stop:669 length:615 start_codon:yes stop_codon:yes gene_type:complete